MFTIKPSKEETKVINWLKKAASKDPDRPTLTCLHVNNGTSEACDGFRLHTANTPECLKDHQGVVKPWEKNNLRADTLAEFDEVLDGNYPDTAQVYPRKKAVFTIGVNPKFLIDALSGFDGNVKLAFYSSHEPFTIEYAEEDNEQKALIMPVYIAEADK